MKKTTQYLKRHLVVNLHYVTCHAELWSVCYATY